MIACLGEFKVREPAARIWIMMAGLIRNCYRVAATSDACEIDNARSFFAQHFWTHRLHDKIGLVHLQEGDADAQLLAHYQLTSRGVITDSGPSEVFPGRTAWPDDLVVRKGSQLIVFWHDADLVCRLKVP